MYSRFYMFGAVSGALAVVLGAFGAHALKTMVPPETVSSFDTGVRYQFYHTFALFIVGMLYSQRPTAQLKWAAYSFLIGILLFSGSLYLLTWLKATDTVGLRGLGIITPVGGVFFIIGWLLLLVAAARHKTSSGNP